MPSSRCSASRSKPSVRHQWRQRHLRSSPELHPGLFPHATFALFIAVLLPGSRFFHKGPLEIHGKRIGICHGDGKLLARLIQDLSFKGDLTPPPLKCTAPLEKLGRVSEPKSNLLLPGRSCHFFLLRTDHLDHKKIEHGPPPLACNPLEGARRLKPAFLPPRTAMVKRREHGSRREGPIEQDTWRTITCN